MLLHGTPAVGVSQTLRCWTYIRQGGYHVGHWPTFLVIGSNSLYCIYFGSWKGFSVITSPNPNLSGWNLEYKWAATVRTHTTKMGEITPEVPPKGAKTCFFLPRPFLKQKTWIDFRMRRPVKNFRISENGVFQVPKQLKMDTFGWWCLWAENSSNGTISGDGNHFKG